MNKSNLYWIEVYFENGKTLRKESVDLNDTYKVLCRYNNGQKRHRVQYIKSGYNEFTTGEIIKISDVVY